MSNELHVQVNMTDLIQRAYGAVYKAMHKETGQLLAIKQVPVDSDLQDIIKEISIMQQCDRRAILGYFRLNDYRARTYSTSL